jgi:hypothetical protein
VKEVLTPCRLKEGASDKEVGAFVDYATTQSQVYGWKHSPATYQGILGTLPIDLVQIMAGITTFDGVLDALKACASVKEVVLESEKRMELRREFNNLKQGKHQSVGRYAGQLRGVVGRYADLNVPEEELVTIFVANLLPSLHKQMKGKTFASMKEAVAAAQKKEQAAKGDEVPAQDIIADARRRGVSAVKGGKVRFGEDEEKESDGAEVLREQKQAFRQHEKDHSREMDLIRRERVIREEEINQERRDEERKREHELSEEMESRKRKERSVNAISRDLPEVVKTIQGGAPEWCAYCQQWCQHPTWECVQMARANDQDARGRGRGLGFAGRGRGDRGPLLCYSCNKQGHSKRDCPDQLCFVCQEKGHMSYSCPRSDGRGGRGRGAPQYPLGYQREQFTALQYSQPPPMQQLQYMPTHTVPSGQPQQAQAHTQYRPVASVTQACIEYDPQGQSDWQKKVDAMGTSLDELKARFPKGEGAPAPGLPQKKD